MRVEPVREFTKAPNFTSAEFTKVLDVPRETGHSTTTALTIDRQHFSSIGLAHRPLLKMALNHVPIFCDGEFWHAYVVFFVQSCDALFRSSSYPLTNSPQITKHTDNQSGVIRLA
jgi:hypothetical protein